MSSEHGPDQLVRRILGGLRVLGLERLAQIAEEVPNLGTQLDAAVGQEVRMIVDHSEAGALQVEADPVA